MSKSTESEGALPVRTVVHKTPVTVGAAGRSASEDALLEWMESVDFEDDDVGDDERSTER